MSSRLRLSTLVVILSLLFASCAPKTTPPPVTLKIAVLRVLDALPLYVADKQGYFAANGIQVELTPVASAPERDQLIAAGQADGMINEMTSVLFSNRAQQTVQVVRIARAATADQPVFRVLAGKDSGIASVADLQKVETGISQGTVLEYLFQRLIEAEGFNPADFPTTNIPSIPDRLKLLGAGELKAALLPDPLASLAIQQGATVVIDDSSHPEYGYSTLTFRKAVIDQHPAAIKAFLAAWEKAVSDINANPGQWNALLTERELVPSALLESYQVPPFVTASVPTTEQFADALAWAKGKGLLDKDLSYQDCVNASFLPAKE